jgi:hypothetical protein
MPLSDIISGQVKAPGPGWAPSARLRYCRTGDGGSDLGYRP